MYSKRSSTEVTGQVFLCFGCGSEFSDVESQRKHEAMCLHKIPGSILHSHELYYIEGEGQRKSVCEICRAYFNDGDFVQDHKLLHLNSDHVCYLCETYHGSYKILALHVATEHRDRLGIKQNEEGVNEPYMCSVCILRFSTLKGLQSHEAIHVVEKQSLVCRICNAPFNNDPKSASDHLRSVSHASAKRKLLNVFTCIHCNTNFATRDSYAMHMMIRAKDENCTAAKRHISSSVKATTDDDNPRVFIKQEPPDDVEYASSANSVNVSSRSPRRHLNGSIDSNYHVTSTATSLVGVQDRRFMPALDNTLLLQWPPKSYYSNSICGLERSYASKRSCEKCGRTFKDRDDLAMHIMSVHADVAEEVRNQDVNTKCVEFPRTAVTSAFKPISGKRLYQLDNTCNTAKIYSKTETNLFKNFEFVNEKRCRSNSIDDEGENTRNKRPKSAPSQLTRVENVITVNDGDVKTYMEDRAEEDKNENGIFIADKIRSIFGHSVKQTLMLNRDDTSEEFPGKLACISGDTHTQVKNETRDDCAVDTKSTDCIAATPGAKPRDAHTTPDPTETINTLRMESCVSFEDGPSLLQPIENRSNENDRVTSENEIGHIRAEINRCGDNLWMCKYCPVVFLDRTLYCLHMGIHNVNAPYQCNMCGYQCASLHEFSAHVLHFR